MKPCRLIVLFACLLLCLQAFGEPDDVDKELTTLAEKLAAQVKESGKKKVTVLDFSDLQGNSEGELGRYIAEQLTVNLVMGKREFSILDRANLRSILAEHKLTAQGLVDPENAKKLGQFAGVDALILGSIIPKSNTVSLTAKIITTDTAEIVGAARAEFKNDEAVQQLIAKPTTTETASDSGVAPDEIKKPFGDLQATVQSIRMLAGDAIYGSATLTLVISNTSATTTFGVDIPNNIYNDFNLSNDRGDEFKATEVTGISRAFKGYAGYQGEFTEIPPRSAIKLVSKSQVRWTGKPGEYRPYHFQTTFMFGAESKGRLADIDEYNFVVDVK